MSSGYITPIGTLADTGFQDRTSSTLPAADLSSRVFTITPVSGSFVVWTGGTKHVKTGGASCSTTLTNSVGQHYVYFDTNGDLQSATSPWNIEGNAAPVATVLWNGTNGVVSDERHSCYRNKQWHKWAHDTIGARYETGLTGTFATGSLSVTQGSFHDEDIDHETPVSPLTTCRLLYRAAGGASMTWDAGVTISAKVTAGALKWDNGGTMTSVDSAKFVANWVYATNDVLYPINVVVSQAQYSNISDARQAVLPTLSGLTTAEWKLLYRVIWQNSGGTATYVEKTDYRTATSLPGGVVTSLPASAVTFTPTGNITGTNVQSAIAEIDARELPVNSYFYGAAMTANSQFLSIVNGEALTGITVTCNVYDPDSTLVVSAGSATEPISGIYRYTLSAGSNTKRGTWIFIFSTTNANADGKTVSVEVKSV